MHQAHPNKTLSFTTITKAVLSGQASPTTQECNNGDSFTARLVWWCWFFFHGSLFLQNATAPPTFVNIVCVARIVPAFLLLRRHPLFSPTFVLCTRHLPHHNYHHHQSKAHQLNRHCAGRDHLLIVPAKGPRQRQSKFLLFYQSR